MVHPLVSGWHANIVDLLRFLGQHRDAARAQEDLLVQ